MGQIVALAIAERPLTTLLIIGGILSLAEAFLAAMLAGEEHSTSVAVARMIMHIGMAVASMTGALILSHTIIEFIIYFRKKLYLGAAFNAFSFIFALFLAFVPPIVNVMVIGKHLGDELNMSLVAAKIYNILGILPDSLLITKAQEAGLKSTKITLVDTLVHLNPLTLAVVGGLFVHLVSLTLDYFFLFAKVYAGKINIKPESKSTSKAEPPKPVPTSEVKEEPQPSKKATSSNSDQTKSRLLTIIKAAHPSYDDSKVGKLAEQLANRIIKATEAPENADDKALEQISTLGTNLATSLITLHQMATQLSNIGSLSIDNAANMRKLMVKTIQGEMGAYIDEISINGSKLKLYGLGGNDLT